MKYYIKTIGLALVLLSAGALAMDVTPADKLEAQAAEGDEVALAKLKAGAESGDAAYEKSYGDYFWITKVSWYSKKIKGETEAKLKDDQIQAYLWYKKSADQGYAPGQAALGGLQLLKNGDGVKWDYTQAFAMYKKSADQGYAPGERDLGGIYNGHSCPREGCPGVKVDNAKAKELFTKAADQGDVDAQIYLGDMYGSGIVAYALYDLAGDYQDLGGYYSDLRLTKAQIKTAKALEHRMSKIGVSAAISEYLKSVHELK